MLFSARQREPAREPPGKPAGTKFVKVVGNPLNIHRAFVQAAEGGYLAFCAL